MSYKHNWAGNYSYNAKECHVPATAEEVRRLTLDHGVMKVLGSRHSFNSIADTEAVHVSLERLNGIVELDVVNHRVTVEGGIRYGELCGYLNEKGYALHNLASLPHITIAGACATATHGSGDRNGNLATVVYGIELATGDGRLVNLTRDDGDGLLEGAIVGLGALGIVTKLTLDIVPAFEMTQHVYEGLKLVQLADSLHEVFASGYSVSLFTDWKTSSFNQVWRKRVVKPGVNETALEGESFFGAVLSSVNLHPVPGFAADNCSDQRGIVGPWHERLSHFRMEFTPSAGEELQSEYFVARKDAYEALMALDALRDVISPLLFVSEVRTVAADDLWLSPCYGQDSVGIHFTWKPNREGVLAALPIIEASLEPFRARPHWGKLFAMEPAKLQALYPKLPAFRELLDKFDPERKFRNDYLEKYIY